LFVVVGLNKKSGVILKTKNPTDFTQTGLEKYCVYYKIISYSRMSQLVNDDDVID